MPPLRLIAYLRADPDRPEPADQERCIEHAATRWGWDIVRTVTESAPGTRAPHARDLGDLLVELRARPTEANGVVVTSLDRLALSVADLEGALKDLESAQATLVLVGQEADPDQPLVIDPRREDGALAMAVLVEAAARERAARSSQTAPARAARKPPGPPNAADERIRERIRELHRDHALSPHEIAEQLNAEGVPPLKQGRQWWPSSVKSVLGLATEKPVGPIASEAAELEAALHALHKNWASDESWRPQLAEGPSGQDMIRAYLRRYSPRVEASGELGRHRLGIDALIVKDDFRSLFADRDREAAVEHLVAAGALRDALRGQGPFEVRFSVASVKASARDEPDETKDLIQVGDAARARGYLTKNEFLEVVGWKTHRTLSQCAVNTDGDVENATFVALTTSDERERIEALTRLSGVGWPIASALLHFAHSDPYPILDRRALESLGVADPPYPFRFRFWWDYVQYCRSLANEAQLSMHELDRALFRLNVRHARAVRKLRRASIGGNLGLATGDSAVEPEA